MARKFLALVKSIEREGEYPLTKADVLVTADGGPAHFAGLTAIKNIVLFGRRPLRCMPRLASIPPAYLRD